MKRNVIETVLGAVVLLIAAVFLTFAYSSSTVGRVSGYELHAAFNKIDGLTAGADVKISGVKVGSVTTTHLDPNTYMADVTMTIDPSVKLPTDSVAVIASDGLLGGKYMSLQIGGDAEMLAPGGKILYTQSPPGLEQLLGQVIFSAANNKGNSQPAPAAPGSAPAAGANMSNTGDTTVPAALAPANAAPANAAPAGGAGKP